MKVVIIGSGNVAYHLANAFVLKGINLIQIFGRNENDLQEIALKTGVPFSTKILDNADLYIIAVNDGALEEVSQLITKKNCIVAHTSGSLPIEILQGEYRKAVIYPLQTFSKSKELEYHKIPFFLEAQNTEDYLFIENLALKISDHVEASSYEKRKYVHLSAVFACNFVNHLFARAKEITDAHDIPFKYLLPLIEETTHKIFQVEPKEAQTGPSVRNDVRITKMQEDLLNGEFLKIYKTMNESIKEMYEL
ncbi:Rossmann-like and DUF2520 domain-containing protein [Frigoriflavimonas asaccharolytica]|uniref:Putative short-subunit dehydrogenase-like oxidoreductase (DUF2520 family) n=1 Tax=Frigoriflavimonas asaccharolytica TaxID=2735899 RepID=A0A8J8G800_9FLAO|nr:DUF2520 domain-containing protein [Frigoriflavimonas asaccharolytica]NRS91199.1 putative short-subunit dehydrogenase-like oxidoreductase (DUF2520 family) [Frigoriflavimonas asaccharolytica]